TGRLEGGVELGIVERTIERDDDPSHAVVRPYLEPMGAQLGDQGRLADDEDGGAGVEPLKMTGEHEGGIDDVVDSGGHAESGELSSVVGAGFEGLVGEEGHPAAPRPEDRDGDVGAGDEGVTQVDRSVEVE